MRKHRRFPPYVLQVVCSLLLLAPAAQAADTECEEEPGVRTEIWNLTYIRSLVSPSIPGAQSKPAEPKDNIDTLVDALDNLYGKTGCPHAVQRAGVGRLLLRGKDQELREMEHMLTLVDAPWPQVQLDLWAVQSSGDDKKTTYEIRWMEQQINDFRDRMIAAQEELEQLPDPDRDEKQVESYLAQARLSQEDERKVRNRLCTRANLILAGIEHPPGPLSLNEALVLLALSPDRAKKIEEMQNQPWAQADAKTAELGEKKPFSRLAGVLKAATWDEHRLVFDRFAKQLVAFNALTDDSPKRLSRAGIVTDRLLKEVVDAFAADMRELYLDPLLRKLQKGSGQNTSGLALVGKTRIVVTSGLEAGMSPEMASFIETTRPKPFGADLLNTAFPAKGSEAKSADPGADLTGAARILAGASQAQALLLAAALDQPDRTFMKVAPGIGISVRPTVLPDGSAARLTIDAYFGVTSQVGSSDSKDVFVQGAPSGISKHDVHTDTAINAFDLFDISSFDVQSISPQAPFYVPILGRLPILGPMFQWPRHPKVTHHNSLILVNAVILPRSLDLLRLYGNEVKSSGETKDCEDPKLKVASNP